MVSGQIICVNLSTHVDINSDSIWDRNMYLQPCIDTATVRFRTDTLELLSPIFLTLWPVVVTKFGNLLKNMNFS